MCEYCGCQTITAIKELTREHDEIADLIGDVHVAYQADDLAQMIMLSREIAAVLKQHTVVEEQGLFPVLAFDFPEQIAILEGEHRRIDAVLTETHRCQGRSDPSWPSRLIAVLTLLRQHMRKEQDGVFPAALSTLTAEQWDRLDSLQASPATGKVPSGDQ